MTYLRAKLLKSNDAKLQGLSTGSQLQKNEHCRIWAVLFSVCEEKRNLFALGIKKVQIKVREKYEEKFKRAGKNIVQILLTSDSDKGLYMDRRAGTG